MQATSPFPPSRNLVSLPETAGSYTEEQFTKDDAVTARLLGDPGAPGLENGHARGAARPPSDDECLQRVCDYFYEKYGRSEAGNRYLRFGAVHAAIGKNRGLIEGKGLSDPNAAGQIDRFLLLLLLTAPVTVDTDAGEAWIAQGEVENAVRRALLVRGE